MSEIPHSNNSGKEHWEKPEVVATWAKESGGIPYEIRGLIRKNIIDFNFYQGLTDSDNIIEIGIGAQTYLDVLYLPPLFDLTKQFIGMDLSYRMVSSVKNDYQIPVIQADARQLPFASASVSRIICPAMMRYLSIDEQVSFVKDMFRVVKPNGKICLIDFVSVAHPSQVNIFLPQVILEDPDISDVIEQNNIRTTIITDKIKFNPQAARFTPLYTVLFESR